MVFLGKKPNKIMFQNWEKKYASLQVFQVGWWLGSSLAFIFITMAFHPFTNEKYISQVLGYVASIAILGTIGVIWLSVGIWGRWPKIRAIIQAGIAIFLLILNLFMENDLLEWSEWRGFPPVMEWGLYNIYSYMLPIVYFGGFIAMTLVLLTNLKELNENETKISKSEQIWMVIGILGFSIWINLYLFLNHGIFYVLIIQICFICLNILDASVSFIISQFSKKDSSIDTISSRNPRITLQSFNLTHQDLFNGIQTFVKFELFGGLLLLLNMLPFLYLIQIFNFPNLIPLVLQGFPNLVIGIILWLVIYHYIKNRELILFGSVLTFIPVPYLIGIDPYGILIYRENILWIINLTVPGIWLGTLLYTKSMVKGSYAQSFWAIGIVANLILGCLFGFLIEPDEFDLSTGQYGVIIIGLIIIFLIIGKVISKIRTPPHISVPSNSTHLDTIKAVTKMFQLTNSRGTKIALGMLVLIVGGICFTPIYAIYTVQNGCREQILGIANERNYYIWFADSSRTIDARYKPNFAGSPINQTVRMSLAQGEHEGFQAIFTPGRVRNLNLWNFSPKTDLIHIESGDKIGKGNISIFNVEYEQQLTNQYPDRLIPFTRLDTTLTLSGQINYPFYVDVYIPKDIPLTPGIYMSTIRSYCFDYHESPPGIERTYHSRNVEFILEVEVFNFTVPTQRHIGTEIIWSIPEQQDWIRFYQDHRLDSNWPQPPVIKYNATFIDFDWVKYIQDLTLGFELGMKYFPVTWHPTGIDWKNLTYTPQYRRLLEWYIGNITTVLEPLLTPWNTSVLDSAYFFIIDEPQEELYALIVEVAQIIHSISPNLRIMETMNQELDTYGDDFLTEIDIYVQYIHRWEPSIAYPSSTPLSLNGWPTRLASFLEDHISPRKKELWVYLTHNRFPFPDTDVYMTGIMQRNSFWLFWSYHIEGWLYWSFNWGIDLENGYGYAGYGESTLVGFGPENSPISSLRLERVRDGIEDYEYFWLLNYSCSWLETNGKETEAELGRILLDNVDQMYNHPEYLESYFGTNFKSKPYLWAYEPNAAPYLDLRNLIGQELGRLYSLGIIPPIF